MPALALMASPAPVSAHVSEQGLVLLLPTHLYIASGVIAVVLTLLALGLLPHRSIQGFFSPVQLWKRAAQPGRPIAALVTTVLVVCLLFIGWFGPTDPTKNLLPLTIWTLWWIGFTVLVGVFGNLWPSINPWLLLGDTPMRRGLTMPEWLGCWPALVVFILFILFSLAYPAPDNPSILANVVLAYFLVNIAGSYLFGANAWLTRFECFTVLFALYAKLSPFKHDSAGFTVGVPGWRSYQSPADSLSAAVFIVVLLGTGSFDGLNETFWWLNKIGVNPLAFPGRSAIIYETTIGLLLANVLLLAIYAACIALGVFWANRLKTDSPSSRVCTTKAFIRFAIALLPIAMAYHFAHFLTAFIVNAQYALVAFNDPLNRGADLLGLGTFYVTTGFMNSHHSVEAIWLTQAFVVIIGHILSIVLAHAIALRLFQHPRAALLSQLPLAIFMVFYTFLGLWLLASPRGA